MPGLMDTHMHLHFPDFDEDRHEVLNRAKAAGVHKMITVGTDLVSSQACVKLAEKFPGVYAAVGIHPHDVERAQAEDFETIESLLTQEKVKAIGEIGLDFYRDLSPRKIQEEVLLQFLDMQKRTAKPLIVHCRDAYERLREILLSYGPPPFHGVMHCFSSDRTEMFRYLELGFYISFAGPLTYKKSDALREACQACPGDRLLFETDAPFLAPQKYRGKRNEPSYMLETVCEGARVRGMDPESLAVQTTANAEMLFGL